MIGNIDELTIVGTTLPQITLNLPLPLFFSRNGNPGIPFGALFDNYIKINVMFRKWMWTVFRLSNSGVMLLAFWQRPTTLFICII
jgi:hypothetical protein